LSTSTSPEISFGSSQVASKAAQFFPDRQGERCLFHYGPVSFDLHEGGGCGRGYGVGGVPECHFSDTN